MSEALDTTVVDAIASAVAARLSSVPLDQQLWDVDDCARYFRVEPRYFRERMAVLPTFPSAKRYPVKAGRMNPRYVAAEVIAWAMR